MTEEQKVLIHLIEEALSKYSRVDLAEAAQIRDDLLDIYLAASVFVEEKVNG